MAEDPFLAQIESFGLPPPEKKLIEDETAVPSSLSTINYELARKISSINIEKQKNFRSDVIAPSGGMIAVATSYQPHKQEKISNDQVNEWKTQVLHSNRPRATWTARDEVEDSRAYARSIAAQMNTIQVSTEHTKSPSSSTIDSYPSPQAANGKMLSDSERYSDYSSASSHKSPSPPQSSPNYSLTTSPYHRPIDINYQNRETQQDYRIPEPHATAAPQKKVPPSVPKKTVTIVAGARVVPIPNENQKQPERVAFHGGLRSQTRTANFNPLRLPMDTSNYTWTPLTTRNGEDKWKTEKKNNEIDNIDMEDPARRGVVRVVVPKDNGTSRSGSDISSRPASSASSTATYDSNHSSIQEARRKKWQELDAALEEEEDDLRRVTPKKETKKTSAPSSTAYRGPIVVPAKAPSSSVVGDCGVCHKRVLSSEKSTTSDGQLLHADCFVCSVCQRNLGDRQHVFAKGRLYCEEDYRYTGLHETTEKCAKCGHPILDMVLQALGRYFHPACFRCTQCKCCLDGIPFALDTKGDVYCMTDYHELFAPRCAACANAILPDPKTGETVRVVAINNDYHVDCYVCEGCNTRLTDDSNSKCYPLGKHLLCYDCHLLWRRTGGETQTITDL